MDKIIIKNLRINIIIGVYDWERKTPQEVIINVFLQLNTFEAGLSDKIDDCVDYSVLIEDIRNHVTTVQRYTVEALAEDIARICLSRPKVLKTTVRVEKPGIIPGVESVGIEIEREQLR